MLKNVLKKVTGLALLIAGLSLALFIAPVATDYLNFQVAKHATKHVRRYFEYGGWQNPLDMNVWAQGQTANLQAYGNIPWLPGSTATATAAIPAANLVGVLYGTPTAAATYTTDTATNLCGLFPFVGNNNQTYWNWDLYVINLAAGADTITMAGGSGVTLVGTGTAPQNDYRHLKFVLTECRAGQTAHANMQSLELGVY